MITVELIFGIPLGDFHSGNFIGPKRTVVKADGKNISSKVGFIHINNVPFKEPLINPAFLIDVEQPDFDPKKLHLYKINEEVVDTTVIEYDGKDYHTVKGKPFSKLARMNSKI